MPVSTFDATPASVGASRAFVEEVAAGSLLGSVEQVEVLRLLTSEVATNAVRHARTAFTVEVVCAGGRVHVEVCDDEPARPTPTAPHEGQVGGWGLHLLAALAQAWGVAPRPPGKCVWFEVTADGQR